MFKLDSPVMVFLGKIADLILLNLLVIICSIPVFTIGASWTALYYVTLKMVKNEESYIAKDFFKSFKENFKQATFIWLINLIALIIMGIDALIVFRGSVPNMPQALTAAMLVMAIVMAAVMVYVYPVLSRFYNNTFNTVKNAFLLAISNFPYTLLFLVVIALPYVVTFGTGIGIRIMPVFALIGVSGPAYVCSLCWKRIFKKYEPKEEDTQELVIGENDERQEEETERE
ncbi:MAG: YesL family protein [Lachnospiraceae bacterium]|nr:YesL family protein [Lachnospiraceae bacterium]